MYILCNRLWYRWCLHTIYTTW